MSNRRHCAGMQCGAAANRLADVLPALERVDVGLRVNRGAVWPQPGSLAVNEWSCPVGCCAWHGATVHTAAPVCDPAQPVPDDLPPQANLSDPTA